MHRSLHQVCFPLLLLILLLGGCGRGKNANDVFPGSSASVASVSGPDSFLLFPNPQKQDDNTLQTNTTAYATAYYEAIDPSNDRDTLDKWKAANGFGGSTGSEVNVVFGDVNDLGYGRRLTGRKNADGTMAFMVENYLVSAVANYEYNDFNVEAAILQDQRWHVGTNGIEFSPALGDSVTANCGNCFVKFYTFNPSTGTRLLQAQLDGRGDKAMPGICANCHGGRDDALTPATDSPTGKQLFPIVWNSVVKKRGDLTAKLQPFNVGTFGYSTRPGYARTDLEANLKILNQWVLCSYPLRNLTVTPTGNAEDVCRRVAASNEWQGTAAEMVKSWYGGNGMPNAAFSDTYVPAYWQTANASASAENLYKTVIAPTCRVCHILRGTKAQAGWTANYTYDAGISFMMYKDPALSGQDFYNFAGQIKSHIIDRGNMPLSKIIYNRFWNSSQPETMADFLASAQSAAVRDSNNAVLKPGRPVAKPGPNRTTTSPVTLSGADSLFASSYSWSLVSGPGTLTNTTSVSPTLTSSPGVNIVRLVVSNGTTSSAPVDVQITVSTSLSPFPAPAAVRFSDIKAILQSTSAGCSGCHIDPILNATISQPISYANYDRNGDSVTDAKDDRWFYTELRARINFTDIEASPLLRRPAGLQHGAGYIVLDASLTTNCSGVYPECPTGMTSGQYNAAVYNMFVNWILNGAPYQ